MLSAILSILEAETPEILSFIHRTLPALIAFFKGQGTRDSVLVAIDAALEASRLQIDAEIHSKPRATPIHVTPVGIDQIPISLETTITSG
jgi:hypothetical protein